MQVDFVRFEYHLHILCDTDLFRCDTDLYRVHTYLELHRTYVHTGRCFGNFAVNHDQNMLSRKC